MPTSLSNPHGLFGLLVDSFLLTVENSIIKNKGNIAAQNPLWWGVPFIDLGKSANSKLYIMITEPMQNRFAKISINAAIVNYGAKKTGELQIKSIIANKPIVSKQSVVAYNGFINYTFTTPKFDSSSNPIIEFFSTDFDDITIREVLVEIYNPITLAVGR
jgi:hypothetical protein